MAANVLVVAKQTAGSRDLIDAITERAARAQHAPSSRDTIESANGVSFGWRFFVTADASVRRRARVYSPRCEPAAAAPR